ncbi:MAG: T9SS type A sorting domain-containing protein [Chitinophagales bacterium]
MRKFYFFAFILFTTPSFSQVVILDLEWIVYHEIIDSGYGFMDYTDDVIATATSNASVPFQSSLYSGNSDGINNFTNDMGAIPEVLGGIYNNGAVTFAIGANISTNTIEVVALDNFTGDVLGSFAENLEDGYNVIESIGQKYTLVAWGGYENSMTCVSTVLNLTTNKKEVWITRIGVDPLTYSFGASQTIIDVIPSRSATPAAVEVDNANNVYVWGTVERNAGGTTHDCFLLKLDPDLNLLYTRMHASYTGRDDEAVGLVFDSSGNLFGVSNSENSTSPYYTHGAVFKINPITGKKIWLKRIGMYDAGDTGTHEVRADYCGDGIAITGNTPNATNQDSRTWRIDADGNILWNRVLNLETEAGSFETGSSLTFCEVTCDVIVAGFRRCMYPMCGGVYIIRYDAETGAVVWGPQNYSGGDTDFDLSSGLQINYGTIDNSVYLGSTSFTATDDLWQLRLNKYNQVVLRTENEAIGENELMLSPNPAISTLNMKGVAKGEQVRVMNISGEIIMEFIAGDEMQLDISGLPAGIYLVQTTGSAETRPARFVKIN